nr:hypothetical protein [Tanacetum cinerariifolium]
CSSRCVDTKAHIGESNYQYKFDNTKFIKGACETYIGSLIRIYEPPPPHIVMNIYNEEKVRKPSEVHDAGKSVGYATITAGLVYASELAIRRL